jgi:hypothetical protein
MLPGGSAVGLMENLDDQHLQHSTSESNYVPANRKKLKSHFEKYHYIPHFAI